MSLTKQSFEAGTPGVITNVNPPTTSIDTAFTPVVSGAAALNVINSDSMHGTQCMSSSQSNLFVSSDAYAPYAGLAATTIAARFYFKIMGAPGGAITLFRLMDNTGVRCLTLRNQAGTSKIQLLLTDIDTLVWTSINALSQTQWYRVEVQYKLSTSAANGSVAIQVYAGDSNVPVESGAFVAKTSNAGTSVAEVRFGRQSATTAVEFRYDDIAYQDGTLTPIGWPAFLYTPPIWRNPVPMGRALIPGIPTATCVYRKGGVWSNVMSPGIGEIDTCDVDATTGTPLVFTRPIVLPISLYTEMSTSIPLGDPSWTPGTLTPR